MMKGEGKENVLETLMPFTCFRMYIQIMSLVHV